MKPRKFQFRGGNAAILESRSPEILLCGPAGTGKSFAILMKMFLVAERNPKFRGLIVRRYRETLTDTALVTWEEQVVPPGHPVLQGGRRSHRHSYCFSNGAEIVLCGMDKPGKVLSSQYDIGYYQEATEGNLDQWDKLLSRFRNSVISYGQLIGDCNPDHPKHWLKQRADKGLTELVTSRLEDNPAYWQRGKWTEQGERYRGMLDRLTGHNRRRLLDGEWCAAEGLVYAGWSDEFVNRNWQPTLYTRYIMSVDWGFNHPAVVQWWALDDRQWTLLSELVRTETTVEALAKEAKVKTKWPVSAIVCDHDAEDRATFEQHFGMRTIAANKDVEGGIHRMQEAIAAGRIRITGIVHKDVKPAALTIPQGFAEEITGYVWDENRDGLKETPKKLHDHSMDASRYAVMYAGPNDSPGWGVSGSKW